MKIWYALTCPICRLRHSLRRFVDNLEPITYPAQLVTGGGRASGFHVIQYLPWSTLTSPYRNPELWRAVNCEYIRLAGAYDQFYECLGFLSPQIRELLQTLNHEIFRLQTRCRDLEDRLGTASSHAIMEVIEVENSEKSSEQSTEEMKKTEEATQSSSNETMPLQTTFMSMVLEETGTFRICTPPNLAKQTASVLKRLNEREREAWCRKFTPSCIEAIVSSPNVDDGTKRFFQDIARKNKEL